jgi:hypothetical protein
LIWVSPPGDYAIVNSNHIPDGTKEHRKPLAVARSVGVIDHMGCGDNP